MATEDTVALRSLSQADESALLPLFISKEPIFNQLLELKRSLRSRPEIIQHFQSQKKIVNEGRSFNKKIFSLQGRILEQVDLKTKAVSDIRALKSFFDVNGAPGGFTAYLLNKFNGCKGIGYNLAKEHGGREDLVTKSEHQKRFRVTYVDISQMNVPPQSPSKQQFDLAILSGWIQQSLDEDASESKSEKQTSDEISNLTQKFINLKSSASIPDTKASVEISLKNQINVLSQLILAISGLIHGGNLILILSNKESIFVSSLILMMHTIFDSVQLTKPSIPSLTTPTTPLATASPSAFDDVRSTFILVCKGLRSKECIPEFKRILSEMKEEHAKGAIGGQEGVGGSSHYHLMDPGTTQNNENVEKLIELYRPLWELQLKSLQKLSQILVNTTPLNNNNIATTSSGSTIQSHNLTTSKLFTYAHDVDTQGLIYWLTGGDARSPNNTGVTVRASSVAVGEPLDFLSREKVRCWTQNLPFSWYCVDIGENRSFIPTHYTMGYASSGNACVPRYWIFQGANSITRPEAPYGDHDILPMNDTDWHTLAIHNNDTNLSSEWATHTWRLSCRTSYRYFRVVQTGPNTFPTGGGEDNWSNVLVANRFELYGSLLPSDVPPVTSPTPVAVNYGSTTPYVPPMWIRADPELQRELVDILAYLLRPQNDQKTEKVKVHEIHLDE